MKSNTQNAKIMHYARAFDYRGIEYSKKPFKFSNTEAGFRKQVKGYGI